MKIILADNRIHCDAGNRLEAYGEVCYIETQDITYPSISGHPDVFFCKVGDVLVFAPNAPPEAIRELEKAGIPMVKGHKQVGKLYPKTASYNCVVTDQYLIHNQKHTDPELKVRCSHLEPIHVNQAYTRCNLLALPDGRFMTSDRGIEKTLAQHQKIVLYVNPQGMLLPGQANGFIGGTCGISENKIFFIGSLDHFSEGDKIREFLTDYEIIELYNGPLFDGGSLIFLGDGS
jgi:hypothetical protein